LVEPLCHLQADRFFQFQVKGVGYGAESLNLRRALMSSRLGAQ
jgi:hypothetical protein